MAKDIVCGNYVNEQATEFTSEFLMNKYYFCKEECKNKFDMEPIRYTSRRLEGARRGGCCG